MSIKKIGERLILTGPDYARMRQQLAREAGFFCEGCGKHIGNRGEAHHLYGRGMGAAKRNDRIFVDGKRNLRYLCQSCHGGHHAPKAVPKKERLSDSEFRKELGL